MHSMIQHGYSLAGALLRRERERQGLKQLELCDGLCSNASLSRLEQGKMNHPDHDLLCALFERLGLYYCVDAAVLKEAVKRIAHYYEAQLYHFKNPSWKLYWTEAREKLFYSPLFLEVLLIEADQLGQRQGGRAALQQCLEMLESWRDELTPEQEARLDLLYPLNRENAAERVPALQRAYGVLGDSESGLYLLEALALSGRAQELDELVDRLVVKSHQEGNSYNLARLTQLQAQSALLLGNPRQALQCAQRAVYQVWATDWKELLNELRLLQAKLLMLLNRFEEAYTVLQAVQKDQDNGYEVQLTQAILAYRTGRMDEGDTIASDLSKDLRLRQPEGLKALRYQALQYEKDDHGLDKVEAGRLLEKIVETATQEGETLEAALYKPLLVEYYKRSRQYKKIVDLG